MDRLLYVYSVFKEAIKNTKHQAFMSSYVHDFDNYYFPKPLNDIIWECEKIGASVSSEEWQFCVLQNNLLVKSNNEPESTLEKGG